MKGRENSKAKATSTREHARAREIPGNVVPHDIPKERNSCGTEMLAETDEGTKNVVPHDICTPNPMELDAEEIQDASNVILHDIPRSIVVLHRIYRRRLRNSIYRHAQTRFWGEPI